MREANIKKTLFYNVQYIFGIANCIYYYIFMYNKKRRNTT